MTLITKETFDRLDAIADTHKASLGEWLMELEQQYVAQTERLERELAAAHKVIEHYASPASWECSRRDGMGLIYDTYINRTGMLEAQLFLSEHSRNPDVRGKEVQTHYFEPISAGGAA